MSYDLVSLGDVKAPQALSWVDMHALLGAMTEADVLDDYAQAPKPFKSKRRRAIESAADYHRRLQELNYQQRSFRSRRRNKVPREKFQLGGGWIISAEESAVIGRVMRAWLTALSQPSVYPVPRGYRKRLPAWDGFDWKYIKQFVSFCERCGKSHGFRVE